jgi:hypothetical protein
MRRFGDWVGLLLLAGLAACSVDVLTAGRDLDAEVTRVSSVEVDASDAIEVQVRGINGSVTVVADRAATRARVRAERRVRSDTRADAEQFMTRVRAQISVRDRRIFVETVQPSDTDGRDVSVDYHVTIPEHLSVRVTNVNGSIEVRAVRGSVDVDNVNGGVRVLDVEGDVRVDLLNGEILCEVTPLPGGVVALTVVNGSVALGVPTSVSAAFEADVTNGTISLSGLTLHDATTSPRSVRGRLGAGDGLIDLVTTNGSISVLGR